MKGRIVPLVASVTLLILFAFTTTAAMQKVMQGPATGIGEWAKWIVLTYVGEEGPFSSSATLLRGGGVSFDFLYTPDRSMLITESPSNMKHLIGKTLYAHVVIEATPGATFNYYDTGGTLPANVRFYFQKPNAPGCPTGWHPERPDCEAQYWWSNPVSITLGDLAALGAGGFTLVVPVDPDFWSDRDGHMGTATVPIDHVAAFYAAADNVEKIGVSFGGGNNFAFGCGVDLPSVATFKLLDFVASKK